MLISRLTDRNLLEKYFRQDLAQHVYSLGDLDDFYWPDTACYGLRTGSGVDKVVVLYRGAGLPVLLALADPGLMDHAYLAELTAFLPDEFYAHLSPGLEDHFADRYLLQEFGQHNKMELDRAAFFPPQGSRDACQLRDDDLAEALGLYQISYPGNAFDPRMLSTGMYFGIRRKGSLVSVGGVHVYSSRYGVAALGNITTHPDHRNQGLARLVTSRICQALLSRVDFIGLNVKATNQAAIRLYQALGFKFSVKYAEFSLKKRF